MNISDAGPIFFILSLALISATALFCGVILPELI